MWSTMLALAQQLNSLPALGLCYGANESVSDAMIVCNDDKAKVYAVDNTGAGATAKQFACTWAALGQMRQAFLEEPAGVLCCLGLVLRSKGLKDAICVGWFGNDWDCSVGCPPEAMIT